MKEIAGAVFYVSVCVVISVGIISVKGCEEKKMQLRHECIMSGKSRDVCTPESAK